MILTNLLSLIRLLISFLISISLMTFIAMVWIFGQWESYELFCLYFYFVSFTCFLVVTMLISACHYQYNK